MKDVAKKEISAGKDPMGLARNSSLFIMFKDWRRDNSNPNCAGIRSDRSNS